MNTRISRRQVSTGIIATAATAVSGIVAESAPAVPNYINLGVSQTPIKDQGNRRTCITFGALAALEANLKRAGHGQVVLSEQFLNHLGKMFWLHPVWSDIINKGEDGSEGQVGAFAGGNGTAYLTYLSKGMRVAESSALPYHPTDYTTSDHPHLANAWDNAFWNRQRRMNDFNLDTRFLPRRALTQSKYYSVQRVAEINARDVNAIERVLASTKEVVWDFRAIESTMVPDAVVWQVCDSSRMSCTADAHSMLLIGYDRRDPDSNKHYFLAKNSYGPTKHPDGFTRISYDYVRRYGLTASYIVEIAPATPWPELAYIGRWNLNFDGHKGVLDIYHIPGIAQWQLAQATPKVTTTDRRIGSFYDANGRAYKVNGRMTPNFIEFYIDGNNSNARWDQLSGRKFVYCHPAGVMMAGYHTDPDGRVYGGLATQSSSFADGRSTPRPFTANAYMHSWHVNFLNSNFSGSPPSSGTLRFDRIDNSFLSASERLQFDGLIGQFSEAGAGRFEVRAFVDKTQPAKIVLRLRRTAPVAGGTTFVVTGYHLNHSNGIVAGRGDAAGFVMVRQ